jgi:hypothetical protein
MSITVDKKIHYVSNPHLAEQLTQQITSWANSVPAGSFASFYEVMSHGNPNGYPPKGTPLETWFDAFENGGIEGVELLDQSGPTCEQSFGLPKMVHKTF